VTQAAFLLPLAVQQPGWDLVCALVAAVGALQTFVWVQVFKSLARAGMPQTLSRQLVHTTAGPLFVLMWPLFSAALSARFIAAAVPCLNAARLILVGSGVVSDPGLVRSASRSCDRSELLRGPLYYVLVLVGATAAFWRDCPGGLIAISMMCGGMGWPISWAGGGVGVTRCPGTAARAGLGAGACSSGVGLWL